MAKLPEQFLDRMKEQLGDFRGYYATEEETAQTIHDLYDKCGYVIDTHTAVAAAAYNKYKEQSGDETKTVIASTASPFKFSRSVMKAIAPEKADLEEFALVDELSALSGVTVPKAVDELRTAPVIHDHVCEKEEMAATVKAFLGI